MCVLTIPLTYKNIGSKLLVTSEIFDKVSFCSPRFAVFDRAVRPQLRGRAFFPGPLALSSSPVPVGYKALTPSWCLSAQIRLFPPCKVRGVFETCLYLPKKNVLDAINTSFICDLLLRYYFL